MRHQNSVLHTLLKTIPWPVFDRLVQEHAADRGVRTLTTKGQLLALLYGQLSGADSLREIEMGLTSHQARLSRLGLRPVARSTLADANAQRPCAVFAGLLARLMETAAPRLQRAVGEAVYLIDATSLRLSRLSRDWARFSTAACGAKLHVIYDPDADRPVYAAVTAAAINDITPAKAMPIEPGATYVFDLGYYDYGWWATLDAQGCRLVTRLKSNTPLRVAAETKTPVDSAILSDRIGHLPARMARSRQNPFQDPVREIRVKTETGAVLRLVSNDLDASAEAIADLYKRRWAIELFFRWVKQVLKIKHFLGVGENAVRIQIAVALIAFLVLRLAQAAHRVVDSPRAFACLVRLNLLQRRPIDRLLEPQRPSRQDRSHAKSPQPA